MYFTALIDRKSIPESENLAGEARKAVEGFFYRNSEDAYQGCWRVLEERYGNSFVQRAFREKLMRWPKVGANDPLSLQEFFVTVMLSLLQPWLWRSNIKDTKQVYQIK